MGFSCSGSDVNHVNDVNDVNDVNEWLSFGNRLTEVYWIHWHWEHQGIVGKSLGFKHALFRFFLGMVSCGNTLIC